MAQQADPLKKRVEQLRDALKDRQPEQLALQTNTSYQSGADTYGNFLFPYWEEEVLLSTRDYVARYRTTKEVLITIHQAMILFYFQDSKGSGTSKGWISFSELPNGQFYTSAFQGYTSKKLLQHFQRDYTAFQQAAQNIHGKAVSFASFAYQVSILPKVSALIACWKGDQDISPSYRILFPDTVKYHLPTDACAILGSMITSKLIREQKPPALKDSKKKKTRGHEL